MTSKSKHELEKEKICEEILILKKKLEEKTKELDKISSQLAQKPQEPCDNQLTREDILRYSRQMIVPLVSPDGQKKLKRASVLIVGCGGLGCPAAQYLVGCGIGRIGLVDYDVVEINNLHRQLLHSEQTVGVPKVVSLSLALNRINSNVQVDEHNVQLSSANALKILSVYDVIIDASDNVATRYLINDACVFAKKPLVSGSAVGVEGQLTVYNYCDGPCYRCLFPKPPPPETVSNCSDVGVVGPVPGCIGVLQALQAVYLITGNGKVLSRRLLLFDGEATQFRTIQLRTKSPSCPVCSSNPSVTELIDYEQFCGSPASDKERHLQVASEAERITAKFLHNAIKQGEHFLLIDVRSLTEFLMCNVPKSSNVPLKELSKKETYVQAIQPMMDEIVNKYQLDKDPPIYVICRRGNDSQLGVKLIKKHVRSDVYDVIGGLHAWSRDVDPTFPPY